MDEYNYTGGTSDEDFDSNLFNSAPSNDWYTNTYGNDYSFDNNTPQYNFDSSIPQGTNNLDQSQQFGLGGEGIGVQYDPQYTLPEAPQESFDMSGLQDTLAKLFNNKGVMTGLGALIEGSQNKKKSSAYSQLAQQMQPALDPFGSQRALYQQKLQQATQDPYSVPIVRDQVDQIARAQAIKDAAAGRRSNSATSSPAMLAAQAQVAQQYMNSLQTPAGANIGPSGLSNLLGIQQQGINSGINGYASPIASAIGKNNQYDELVQLLEKYRRQ